MLQSYGGFDNPFPETLNDPNYPMGLHLDLGPPIDYSTLMAFHPLAARTSDLKSENTSISQQCIEDFAGSLGPEASWVSAQNITNFENASGPYLAAKNLATISDIEAYSDGNSIVDPALFADGASGLDISHLISHEIRRQLQEYLPLYAGNFISPDSSHTVSPTSGQIWSQNGADHPDQRVSFSGDYQITTKATVRNHPYYSRPPSKKGLYHCPYTRCSHKPEKSKCRYE